jgi:hypothetical protein
MNDIVYNRPFLKPLNPICFPGRVEAKLHTQIQDPDQNTCSKSMTLFFKHSVMIYDHECFWTLDPHSSPLDSHWSRETMLELTGYKRLQKNRIIRIMYDDAIVCFQGVAI